MAARHLGTFRQHRNNDGEQETVVKKMKETLHGVCSVHTLPEEIIHCLHWALNERLVMKHNMTKTVLALAVLATAGCATSPSPDWGFRYEDRDKIAAVAAKIETAAADLQGLVSQPDSSFNRGANTAAAKDTRAESSIHAFAAEAGQFLRTVRAWRHGGQISLDYVFLMRHWDAAKLASSNLMSSEGTKAKIEALDIMMNDLSQLAIHDRGGPAKIGMQPPAPNGKI